ncbi:hypothetical protein GYB22_01310 [bacterium]|nr:hypothetical protein [bacterium]
MKNLKSEFHCKACDRNIVDFRGMSTEVILEVIQKGTCGIFTSDQLTHQSKLKGYRRLLFGALSVLSFLGFSVSPVSAQVEIKPEIETDSIEMEVVKEVPPAETPEPEKQATDSTPPKPKKNKSVPPRSRWIGCPDF